MVFAFNYTYFVVFSFLKLSIASLNCMLGFVLDVSESLVTYIPESLSTDRLEVESSYFFSGEFMEVIILLVYLFVWVFGYCNECYVNMFRLVLHYFSLPLWRVDQRFKFLLELLEIVPAALFLSKL